MTTQIVLQPVQTGFLSALGFSLADEDFAQTYIGEVMEMGRTWKIVKVMTENGWRIGMNEEPEEGYDIVIEDIGTDDDDKAQERASFYSLALEIPEFDWGCDEVIPLPSEGIRLE